MHFRERRDVFGVGRPTGKVVKRGHGASQDRVELGWTRRLSTLLVGRHDRGQHVKAARAVRWLWGWDMLANPRGQLATALLLELVR